MHPLTACFTVDLEQDCPPFLTTYRGIEEGLPRLLALLQRESIAGTFFTTGDVAIRFPDAVRELVAAGHELGCHGLTHRRFDMMTLNQAEYEIRESTEVLRAFYPVTSFRAPNLSLPGEHLAILEEYGYKLDSSQARYKPHHWRHWRTATSLSRIPASITSSMLRLPPCITHPVLRMLANPAVLFVHPWEFVDLTKSRIRLDCRFRTGEGALRCLENSLQFLRKQGASFLRMQDVADTPAVKH